MYRLIIICSLFISVSASYAAEDSIPVNPGMYDINTITMSNFNPAGQQDQEKECIADKEFKPSMAIPDEDSCTTKNVKKSAKKLTFDITCKKTDFTPAMNGSAEASTTDNTISYHIKMNGKVQGQDFSVDSKSEGKRTGDCN